MDEKLQEIFKQGTESSEFNLFNASPSKLGKLAHAGSVSSVRHPYLHTASTVSLDNEDSDDQFVQMMLDEQYRLFVEASRAAQEALSNLRDSLDNAQNDLDQAKASFEENTVTLSDGTKVYYDTETGQFVRQDRRGNWLALEENELIAEAYERANAKGGIVSTKQGKIALDERQSKLNDGELFLLSQQQRLEQIDIAVENGSLSHEEAARQKQIITNETKEYTQELETSNLDFQNSELGILIEDQQAQQSISENRLETSTHSQHMTEEFKALLDDEAVASNEPDGVSFAGSGFENIDDMALAFEAAHNGTSPLEHEKSAPAVIPVPQLG